MMREMTGKVPQRQGKLLESIAQLINDKWEEGIFGNKKVLYEAELVWFVEFWYERDGRHLERTNERLGLGLGERAQVAAGVKLVSHERLENRWEEREGGAVAGY